MADFTGQRQARVTPTSAASTSPTAAYDRRYANPGAGGTIDVPLQDAQILAANGYLIQGLVGTTAQRPSKADADWLGSGMPPFSAGGVTRFFDTTLGVWLIYDDSSATKWRNATTFAAA